MKLRTSLAAVATATAVTLSGAAAADAAPTVNETVESQSNATEQEDATTLGNLSSSSSEEGSSIEDMTLDELKSWIAVVTAVVGILTQILTIATKFAR